MLYRAALHCVTFIHYDPRCVVLHRIQIYMPLALILTHYVKQ